MDFAMYIDSVKRGKVNSTKQTKIKVLDRDNSVYLLLKYYQPFQNWGILSDFHQIEQKESELLCQHDEFFLSLRNHVQKIQKNKVVLEYPIPRKEKIKDMIDSQVKWVRKNKKK